jgi:hypothetical protein
MLSFVTILVGFVSLAVPLIDSKAHSSFVRAGARARHRRPKHPNPARHRLSAVNRRRLLAPTVQPVDAMLPPGAFGAPESVVHNPGTFNLGTLVSDPVRAVII